MLVSKERNPATRSFHRMVQWMNSRIQVEIKTDFAFRASENELGIHSATDTDHLAGNIV